MTEEEAKLIKAMVYDSWDDEKDSWGQDELATAIYEYGECIKEGASVEEACEWAIKEAEK